MGGGSLPMDPLALVIYGVGAALAIGAGIAYRRFYSFEGRARRKLRKAPSRRIADVIDGEIVKVLGTLRYGERRLEAPLTGRPCAAWKVVVFGNQGRDRTPTLEADETTDFLVEDDSGRAYVHVPLAVLAIVQDRHLRSGIVEEPTQRMQDFLFHRNWETHGLFLRRELRYQEAVLEEGEDVAVCGVAHWEPDPDPAASGTTYRDKPMRLRIEGPGTNLVILSDDPSVVGES